MVLLVSSIFSGKTGAFTADAITETMFLEVMHDVLLREPENPFRLTADDYALAAGF